MSLRDKHNLLWSKHLSAPAVFRRSNTDVASPRQQLRGFTIVELLIVIVVIGILAAITIVAYNGITQRAHVVTLQSDLSQNYTTLSEYQITNGAYPANQTLAGLKASPGNTLTYNVSSDGSSYCLQATGFNNSYASTNSDNTPVQGSCSGTTLVSGGTSTPVAVRSSSSTYNDSTSVSVPVPAGAAANDTVVVIASVDNNTATISPPSGGSWTALDQKQQNSPDGQSSAVFWKRLTAADTGTYTFTSTMSAWFDVATIDFTGANTTNPPTISTANINTSLNASPITVTANGLTIASGDALMYVGAMDSNGQYASGWGTPAGFTDGPLEPASGTSWTQIYTATKTGAAAGATGNVSATLYDSTGGFGAGYTAWLVRIPV